MRVRLPRALFRARFKIPLRIPNPVARPAVPVLHSCHSRAKRRIRIFLRSGSAKRQTSDHNNWHKARCGLSRLVPSPVRGERVRDNCAARLPVAPHIQEEAFQG